MYHLKKRPSHSITVIQKNKRCFSAIKPKTSGDNNQKSNYSDQETNAKKS